ncbi:hypothetical protein O0L34_g17354 [Tuta absoluta]|nr:hypothetical protein O0L34_g17354 [Tuta absoluta]
MDSTNKDNNNLVTMVTFNCQNVKTSMEHVRTLCKTADIIVLQETWLMPFDLGIIHEIHDDFSCVATSSMDISSGIIRDHLPLFMTCDIGEVRSGATINVNRANPNAKVIWGTRNSSQMITYNEYSVCDSSYESPFFRYWCSVHQLANRK